MQGGLPEEEGGALTLKHTRTHPRTHRHTQGAGGGGQEGGDTGPLPWVLLMATCVEAENAPRV